MLQARLEALCRWRRLRKAKTALFTSRKVIGLRWNMSPVIVRWLFTVVINRFLLYGLSVWWLTISKCLNELRRVLRVTEVCMSGVVHGLYDSRRGNSYRVRYTSHRKRLSDRDEGRWTMKPIQLFACQYQAWALVTVRKRMDHHRAPHLFSSILLDHNSRTRWNKESTKLNISFLFL